MRAQHAAPLRSIDGVLGVHYVIAVSKDDSLPQRRSIRLAHYDYTQGGAYFVTICTEHKKCYLGAIRDEQMVCNNLGSLAEQCWLEIPKHFGSANLDEFVIMPNHIHGIIFLADNTPQYAPGHSLSERVGAQHAAPAADKVREFRVAPSHWVQSSGRSSLRLPSGRRKRDSSRADRFGNAITTSM